MKHLVMKKLYFLAILVLPCSQLIAQNVFDALRYSTNQIDGTARFSALSGAFSPLGGEISSVGINPAGSSIFLQNQVSFTMSVLDRNNASNYKGTTTEAGHTDLNISNAGAVFIFNTSGNSNWQKFAVGINYNQTNNFDNEKYIAGNTSNSLGKYFKDAAQGTPLNLLQLQSGESISDLYRYLGETEGSNAQNAFLGYQGYIIDPVVDDPANTNYISNTGTGLFQQQLWGYADGYMGQYTLNLSTQYANNFYFGLNLNTHAIDYRQSSFILEKNSNGNSSLKRIGFENNLSVLGNGFSFQLGGIVKLNESLRFSITYDSPTWYTISEETSQYLETSRIEDGITSSTVVDPRIINVFQDYRLQTPYKLSAGSAYVFGAKGLLSFEYAFKDYASTKFGPSNDPYFQIENNTIKNTLKGSSSIKLGGEYRWNELSFRGGLSYEESPLKDSDLHGDKKGFSLGMGYNVGSYSIDFSYARMQQDQTQSLLPAQNLAQLDVTENIFLLTFNINL